VTIIAAIGVLLSLVAIAFAWRLQSFGQIWALVCLLFVHVGLSVYYQAWSLTVAADAWGYYFDPANYSAQPWALGSTFVFKLCAFLKTVLGATYLDTFMLFQAFGFAGLIILARLFSEIQNKILVPQNPQYILLLFVPSVNFWTSAIGKDAPLFFAVSVCLWSMMQLNRRWGYYLASLAIMVVFRPHMAMLAVISLALSTLFGSTASVGRKIGLLVAAGVGIWLTAGAVESTFGVNAISASSLDDYIDQKTREFSMDTGRTSLGRAPFYLKVVSLLFRPLFFDASGAMGLIASVENLAVLLAFVYMIRHWADLAHLMRRVPFVRFTVSFAFCTLLLLSIMYYNVGLGLRERVMAYPMVFCTLVAVWSFVRKKKLASVSPHHPMIQPQQIRSRPVLEV
jgi:hypothetical protein